MPEEKKELILKHLSILSEEKMNISQLHKTIGNISYPTLLKWITVLEAEGKVKVEDYGSVKIISLNKENTNADKCQT